jgi:acetyl-CoA acetyltransferase
VSTAVVGVGRAPYTRHPCGSTTATGLLATAARVAVADAALRWPEIDGLAVASMTLAPDHALDLAWRLGLSPRWISDAQVGGASGVQMVADAASAIETGRARAVLVVAGDLFTDFAAHAAGFNAATRDYLAPLDFGGTNGLFALVTTLQMAEHGLDRRDYGRLVTHQRRWAGANPDAVYRSPLSLEDYLGARTVAEPLTIYDCPPVVAGAEAVVLVAGTDAGPDAVRVRGTATRYNPDHQTGTGLRTPVGAAGAELRETTGVPATDCEVLSLYDDYPAVVLAQALELGLTDDLPAFCRTLGGLALNTSGGQLSAGQAGVGGALLGLTEAVTQLRGRAGARQVERARLALVTGYGMVLYRYGAAGGALLLEAA